MDRTVHQRAKRTFHLLPCFTTLPARCLASANFQVLGGQANGAFDAEILAFGTLNQFGAYLLESLDIARGQGDANLVDFLSDVKKAISLWLNSWEMEQYGEKKGIGR